MHEAYLTERAISLNRHYRDPLRGAYCLALGAMRLLEASRELAFDTDVEELVRGRGIPATPIQSFACAIVERECKMPIRGKANINQALNDAAHVAWKVARNLRRKQILGAPMDELFSLRDAGL